MRYYNLIGQAFYGIDVSPLGKHQLKISVYPSAFHCLIHLPCGVCGDINLCHLCSAVLKQIMAGNLKIAKVHSK